MYLFIFIFVCTFSTLISQNLVIQDSISFEIEGEKISYNREKNQIATYLSSNKTISLYNFYGQKLQTIHLDFSGVKDEVVNYSPSSESKAGLYFYKNGFLTTNTYCMANPHFFDISGKLIHKALFYYFYGFNNEIYIKIVTKKKKKSNFYYFQLYSVEDYINSGFKKQKLCKISDKIFVEERIKDHFLATKLHWFYANHKFFYTNFFKDTIFVYNRENKELQSYPLQTPNFTPTTNKPEPLTEGLYFPNNNGLYGDSVNGKIYRLYSLASPILKEELTMDSYLSHKAQKTHFLQILDWKMNVLLNVKLDKYYGIAGFEKNILWLVRAGDNNRFTFYKIDLSEILKKEDF